MATSNDPYIVAVRSAEDYGKWATCPVAVLALFTPGRATLPTDKPIVTTLHRPDRQVTSALNLLGYDASLLWHEP